MKKSLFKFNRFYLWPILGLGILFCLTVGIGVLRAADCVPPNCTVVADHVSSADFSPYGTAGVKVELNLEVPHQGKQRAQTATAKTLILPENQGTVSIESFCGDGNCDNGTEDCLRCSPDCGPCPITCGNGTCETGETTCSCPSDCPGFCCGNGTCETTIGETCANCFPDCGACAPKGGDIYEGP